MYEQIRQNKQRTVSVVVTFAIFIVAICSVIGHYYFESALAGGLFGAVCGSIYTAWGLLSASKTLIKRSKGRKIEKGATEDIKELQVVNIVSHLSMMANLPEPEIYVIEDTLPNAFAAGFSPKKAVIGVTTGLLDRLNRAEIEGVIAHEIAHIQNYDARLKLTVFIMGNFLVHIGNILLRTSSSSKKSNDNSKGAAVAILIGWAIYLFGGILTKLTQLWVSRGREYLADATAVELTRNPQALVSALEKISVMDASEVADESLASMYFINPFKKEKDSIWSTHPTTKNRIKRLNEI